MPVPRALLQTIIVTSRLSRIMSHKVQHRESLEEDAHTGHQKLTSVSVLDARANYLKFAVIITRCEI